MNWSILFSTFGLIFVAELGDKTQLAVVAQTCKYRRPLPVFLGGSLALTGVTALGAAGGQVLGNLVPEAIIRLVAALGFVIMGALLWREATRPADTETCDEAENEAGCPDNASQNRIWDWKAFGSTLTLLFLAELGDKTQLAVLGLACKHAAPWLVFVGGALALMTVTALGIIGGEQLSRHIPEQLLLKISAGAFVALGILMGLDII